MNTIDALPSKESLLSFSSMSCVLKPLSLNTHSGTAAARVRNPQHPNTSTLQCIDPSTPLSLHLCSHEHIDNSTPQHLEKSAHHHLDHSTHHHFEHYNHKHIDPSTPQHLTHRDIDASTAQHLNTSTPQHLNSSTPQHLNTSTPQHLNSSTPQHFDHLEYIYLRGRIEQLKNELSIANKLKSQLAPLAILSRLEKLITNCKQFRLIIDQQSIEKNKIKEEYKAKIKDLKVKLEQEKRNSLTLANRRQSLVFGEKIENIATKRNSIHY